MNQRSMTKKKIKKSQSLTHKIMEKISSVQNWDVKNNTFNNTILKHSFEGWSLFTIKGASSVATLTTAVWHQLVDSAVRRCCRFSCHRICCWRKFTPHWWLLCFLRGFWFFSVIFRVRSSISERPMSPSLKSNWRW